MITIFPTTASGLTATSYRLSIPHGEGFNLGKERPESVATNLDGSATVTTWAHSITGHITSITVDLTEAQYTALRLIAEHATVLEWVMTIYNRTFQTAVSIVSAVPVVRSGAPYWRCSIRFTIVSELHR